jgi:prepilin-type N-terminal cleavage/methylation domain-containing protein
MRRSARADERGMSLVEVLVALTILAFALIGLMPLFAGAVKTAASANQLTTANTLVREKFEELTGYPRNDARLAVPVGADTASFINDLPSWYNPSTGIVSFASTSPGTGWYVYPYLRTYTVQQFLVCPALRCCGGTSAGAACVNATTCGGGTCPLTDQFVPVPAPSAYTVKLVTVTVRPTQGPFPGLRQTTQSLYLRLPNG